MHTPPGVGAMPLSSPCRRDESGPSSQRAPAPASSLAPKAKQKGQSHPRDCRSDPLWSADGQGWEIAAICLVPSSPRAGGDREGTPSPSNTASTVTAAGVLEKQLWFRMVPEKQTLAAFLHSPGAGESLLMGKENKNVKAQGREGFEGEQGEPAMGSLAVKNRFICLGPALTG